MSFIPKPAALRVALVAPLSFPAGGAATSRVRSLALGLHNAGAAVKVFACADSAGTAHETDWRGIPCVLARPVSGMTKRAEHGFWRNALRRLRHGRIGQREVDFLVSRLAGELAESRFEAVLLYHQQLALAWRILRLCKRHEAKFVQQYAELHISADFEHGLASTYYLRERLHMACIPYLADGHLVISRWLEQKIRQCSRRPILRVPALNNSAAIPDRRAAPAAQHRFVVTYLGGGARRDCLPELLEAMAVARVQWPNVRLRCVGLGSTALGRLREQAKKLGVEAETDLFGWVDDGTLRRLMSETDAFALLRSSDRSSTACFPTRLPEFLSTARPVILTDVGDVGLYFVSGRNAMLVKSGDTGSVANAIITLARDAAIRTEVGAQGMRTGAAEFDYNLHGRQLLQFLQTVTSPASSNRN